MEYFAKTNKLARILSNPRLIVKHFGKQRAMHIQERLHEFTVAETLSQIPSCPPPRCHLLQGDLKNKFAVDVDRNFRIIFEGFDNKECLSCERTEIVYIQIISIEDYH